MLLNDNLELNSGIRDYLGSLDIEEISQERASTILEISNYLSEPNAVKKLSYICTHNSRRSQFVQFWSEFMCRSYGVSIQNYSAGTSETAVYPSVIKTLEDIGFQVKSNGNSDNPKYQLLYSPREKPIILFSKEIGSDSLPKESFAAIMTCDHADVNCPFVPGASKRFSLHYKDPKEFDGSDQEFKAYQNSSKLIATEILLLISKIKG